MCYTDCNYRIDYSKGEGGDGMANKFQIGTTVFDHWSISSQLSSGELGSVFVLSHQDQNMENISQLKVVSVPRDLKDLMMIQQTVADVPAYINSVLSFVMEEVELMTRLNGNPHVVQYFDHKKDPHANGIGCDILVRTEHLLPLEEYVLTCPLTRSDILRLGVEMCRALEDCHQKNILHRDIQLNRIYATKSGNFKLGDFAIPCVEASDLPSLGVEDLPHLYMAPELCKGEDYDHTVDIYALSLVLYQLLNKNRLAFVEEHRSWVTEGDLRKAQALRLSGASLPPPFFAKKGKLYKVLAKAAQPKAKDRYQSAQAFRRDLELLMPKKEDRIPLYPSIAPFQPQNFGKQSVIGAIFGLQPLRGLNSAETFGLF